MNATARPIQVIFRVTPEQGGGQLVRRYSTIRAAEKAMGRHLTGNPYKVATISEATPGQNTRLLGTATATDLGWAWDTLEVA